jgi:glyoxylase-like metal-dependent hydrolase (beta-lactamase superfamily II)
MIFRQLFEPESSTYTYLIGCPETGEALLIDPVVESVERDLAELGALALKLALTLDTHVHADHVTAAARLRALTGCRVAFPSASEVAGADVQVSEGEPVRVGRLELRPLFTPGHTADHHCYHLDRPGAARVFTGDALLIDGCGRTDFQGGDPATLYRAIHAKIFSLPGETLVYPGHDYQKRHVSSVAQERERNPRLGGGRTVEEFTAIMEALALPRPRKIDFAVPANRRCGEAELASG